MQSTPHPTRLMPGGTRSGSFAQNPISVFCQTKTTRDSATPSPAETTSAKAGGQWAVSVVEFKGKEQELGVILQASYMKFKNSIGQGFGVSERPNYTATRSHNLDVVPPGLIPQPVALPRMPFQGHTQPRIHVSTR